MSRKLPLVLAGMAVLALAAGPAESPKLPPLKFTDTRLANGLRVIILENHDAPVYSIAVSYNVGSRNERKGRTGFAHLFEHMMFKGSEKVGPGEHFFLIFNNGGNMNGTTSQERTIYFETLPKNQLDLALFLESDRMRSLLITQENLDNQRRAVQEERRLGLDNQPYGRTYEKIQELTFENFAYKHSVIGSMEDLDAASVEDVRQFFTAYYAPNNAVLALAGDLNSSGTLARVRKYFANIPKQPAPAPVDATEPRQTGERRAKLDDKLARLARLDLSYKLTPGNTPDFYAMQALGIILAGGDSSRLYQSLVKEKEAATAVFGGVQESRGASVFRIIAMVRPGKTAEEVESLIAAEISRLQNDLVTDSEMARVRSGALRGAVQSREGTLYTVMRLADDAVLYSDPGLINTQLARRLAAKPADIRRVARAYLAASNRCAVVTIPAAQPGRVPAPAR